MASVRIIHLDLSFNNIQAITGLEKLVNLEDLSLYSNRIQRLENLDTLRKLEVLSIGRNKLTDSEDLIYLRKFPALRSLCLHGNPLCDKDGYLLIVNAFLPKLVFLDYKRIDEKLKEQAYQTHQLFVDELNAKEMNERELEKQRTEMDAQKTMHRRAFVAEGFTKECKGVFELGLNELKKRDKELADFWSALNLTKKENYEKGTKLLDEFKLYQKETLQELENLSDKVAFEEKMKDYNQRINALQYELMHNEFILVDQLEELIKDFELNMKDMIDSFIEHVEEHFVECREQQAQFNEKLTDLTSLVLDRFLRGDYTPNVSDQLITARTGITYQPNCQKFRGKYRYIQLPTSPPQIIGGRNCGGYNHCTTSTQFLTADDDDETYAEQTLKRTVQDALLRESSQSEQSRFRPNSTVFLTTKLTAQYQYTTTTTVRAKTADPAWQPGNERVPQLNDFSSVPFMSLSLKFSSHWLDQFFSKNRYLLQMFVDKSSVTNALQASHDAHLLQIDNLADSIGKQARDWYKELMDDIWKREGHQRNRNKVMELNLIVDAFRRAFDTVEANVRDRKFEDEVLTSQELQMTSSILLTHQPSF
ncbi:leucine-rich repeat-containing protein 48 [Clonorchis sinensis]|uniref:Dynein regulatory complex subunit 3 n=1 Tax=Clonorchis sinensis TaxID=79923 RepID=G7YT65_CLOSI|nr:leucine-rich repeat-containing protein 48 [Clonorchis sinensis]